MADDDIVADSEGEEEISGEYGRPDISKISDFTDKNVCSMSESIDAFSTRNMGSTQSEPKFTNQSAILPNHVASVSNNSIIIDILSDDDYAPIPPKKVKEVTKVSAASVPTYHSDISMAINCSNFVQSRPRRPRPRPVPVARNVQPIVQDAPALKIPNIISSIPKSSPLSPFDSLTQGSIGIPPIAFIQEDVDIHGSSANIDAPFFAPSSSPLTDGPPSPALKPRISRKKERSVKGTSKKAKKRTDFDDDEFDVLDDVPKPPKKKRESKGKGKKIAPVQAVESNEKISDSEDELAIQPPLIVDEPNLEQSSKQTNRKKRKSEAASESANKKLKVSSAKTDGEFVALISKDRNITEVDNDYGMVKGPLIKTSRRKPIMSDDEDTEEEPRESPERSDFAKEAPMQTPGSSSKRPTKSSILTPMATKNDDPPKGEVTSLTAQYSIASRRRSAPMSELIKRANGHPASPFHTPISRATSLKRNTTPIVQTAYSPYAKSSRVFLSRIAPLHPNRRTPPPPPPRPPPPKKSKKQLDLEEQWEEELVESVGGATEWACMSDVERSELRKAKWAHEMGGWDD